MNKVNGPASFVWLGHATLVITAPTGQRIVVDPWLETNPAYPTGWDRFEDVSCVLVTHGHPDHFGDALEMSMRTNAPVVANAEINAYLASQGASRLVEINSGGTVSIGGTNITMVHADHSSGITDGEGQPSLEGGSAAGFILRWEGKRAVYLAGDTNVFGDMRLIKDLYRPAVGFLPIGGTYTMGPAEAALAVELLGLERVVPIHYGTFPELTGTPEELISAVSARKGECEVAAAQTGEQVDLPI